MTRARLFPVMALTAFALGLVPALVHAQLPNFTVPGWPQGPAGLAGPAGPAGPTGPVGPQGLIGPQGQNGGNWMRDHVRQYEQAMRQRVLGHQAAPDLFRPSIVGGTVAPPDRWRFLFGLLTATIPDNFQAQYCAGFLVHPWYVLATAHCVDFLQGPGEVDVLTGTHRLDGSGTRRTVQLIIIHPQWDPETIDYDIALLQLTAPVDGIAPVTLLAPSTEPFFASPGTAALVAGWGNMEPGFPIDLHEVQVPIVPQSDCNDANSYDGLITDRMLCAGLTEGGKDSCQGDSGGPLVVQGLDGQWTLAAGIVSWGSGCADPDLFGVYTRVAELSMWVNSNLVDRIPSPPRRIDCGSLPPRLQWACLTQGNGTPQPSFDSPFGSLPFGEPSSPPVTPSGSQP